MSLDEYVFKYRRNLPHIQPEGATFFITFRLHGSIPQSILNSLQRQHEEAEEQISLVTDEFERAKQLYIAQKRHFGRFDKFLDQASAGPQWLKEPKIVGPLIETLHLFDQERYNLDAYCIMSNHGHVVLKPLRKEDGSIYTLKSIMHSIKSYTANEANRILNRIGQPFWQAESYDHVVRGHDEWIRILQYVMNNPVKAGLVNQWDDWQWSYCPHT